MTIPIINARSIAKLRETIRTVDSLEEGPGRRRNDRGGPGNDWSWVEITSLTQIYDRYPAARFDYDAVAETWTQRNDCWAVALEGAGLGLGIKYPARIAGVAEDGLLVLQIRPGKGEVVKITGAAVPVTGTGTGDEAEVYPAVVQLYDPETGIWITGDDCYVVEINGAAIDGWGGDLWDFGDWDT